MEKHKRLVMLLVSLLVVMTLAVCFIGYSMYLAYDQLDNIRRELDSIDYELSYVTDAIWKVHNVLDGMLFELRY